MKRTLALLLSLCLLLALCAGCGSSKIESYSDEEVAAAEEAAAVAREQSDPVNAFAADTVVCTINGRDCTWEEYYYWLNNYRMDIENKLGLIEDWDALNAYYTSNTNEEVVRSLAQSEMLYCQLILGLADKAGVLCSDEDAAAELALEADSFFGDGNGEYSEEEKQAFEDYLVEQRISYDLQLLIAKERISEQNYFEYMTAQITDDDVLEWANAQGYMSAKHILLMTVDSQTREPLSDGEIAAAGEKAQELYAQLAEAQKAGDEEAFLALFDELMNENSADTGLALHPNGYVFLPGEMVSEFETAVQELDENYAMSQPVESPYGWHIILRQPLDPDEVLGQNSYGYDVTLRDYALNNIFSAANQDEAAVADIQWADGFEELDLAALFATVE